jgi:ribonuclease HI
MLQQPILSKRIKKWAYYLIEHDLAYKPWKSMKGQVVVDFIIGHSMDQNKDGLFSLVSISPWKLFFYGSTCREGQGVGIVLVSPRGVIFERLTCLEYFCTNNQVNYEAILWWLQMLSSMDVIEAFGDSLLVVSQISGIYQCFDGSLNAYLDIGIFNNFTIQHVSRDEITVVNNLGQHTLGFRSNQGVLYILKKWMIWFTILDVPVCSQCIVLKSVLLNPVQ